MDQHQWDQLSRLFERAVALPPAERAAFLDEACAEDPTLRHEVETLLKADAEPGITEAFDHVLKALRESWAKAAELQPGQVVTHYEILEPLGGGGMGLVYKARDTRLDRTVALKFLPPHLSADAVAKRRFIHEAKAASALDHPNICTIYEIGEHDPQLFIAMACYEGETLKQKIDGGRLPLAEALDYARQMAEGLERAHEAGIVHRDIKPANVMVTKRGRVKILDFGLAKVAEQTQLTQAGSTLGTVSYMSPEQARGQAVDHRTDIWSLGVVLYEMLVGERPFRGDYDQAVLYQILNEQPKPITELRTDLPLELEPVVNRCIAKNPEERYQALDDLLVDLRLLHNNQASPTQPFARKKLDAATTRGRWLHWWVFIAAATLATAALITVGLLLISRESQTATSLLAVRPLTSFDGAEFSPGWSPDGSQIVFGYTRHGSMDISVMSLGGGEPRRLAESPYDDTTPRWSPDGTKIAFLSDRGNGSTIYWVPPTGGVERKITETHIPYLERWIAVYAMGGMPWSPDSKELVFSRLQPTGEIALWIINLETAKERQLTHPPEGADDLYASWSWGGQWIAFSRDVEGRCRLILQPLNGDEPRILAEGDVHYHGPAWSPDDRRIAVYSDRAGALNIWEIDVASGDLSQLTSGAGNDLAPVYSSKGDLVYSLFTHKVNLYLAHVDAPLAEHRQLTSHTLDDFFPRLSPDGRQVVYQSSRTGNDEIWLLDIETGSERQLTQHLAADRVPDWSPDGEHIVFVSNQSGAFHLWMMNADGGDVRQLAKQPIPMPADDWNSMSVAPRWSPDGKVIGYLVAGDRGPTLWLIDANGTNPQPSQLSGILGFDWYRDSRHVVYNRKTADGSGATEMLLVDLETGEEVLLVQGLTSEVTVASDGSAIAYSQSASHFNQVLYVLRLAESEEGELPRPLGEPQRLIDGQGMWHVHNGGWSQEGNRIVYSQDADQADIYAILQANRP